MNEKYFPFNSVNGDRKFKAEDWANYFSKALTTGIFPYPAVGLKVMSNNNMTLTVNAGSANIEGYFYTLFSNKVITLETATATNRTDLIVLRWSKVNRNISIEILKNSTNRIWNDDIKDLILAKVTVRALTTSVLDADITDTRLSENCGIVNSLLQADTEEIFRQYESWFNYNKNYYDTHILNWTATKQSEFENWTTDKQEEFISWSETEKEKFIAWLDDMKGILDEDAVGNILNRINTNAEKINQNTEQLLTLIQTQTEEPTNEKNLLWLEII